MFTRRVRIQLEPASIKELSRKIHNEITSLPYLQEGFFDAATRAPRQHAFAVKSTRRFVLFSRRRKINSICRKNESPDFARRLKDYVVNEFNCA